MFVEAQDEFDYDEAVEALQRVFGIVGICPMVIEENKDMEHLTETVIKFIDDSIQSRILHSRFMQEEEINSSSGFHGDQYGNRWTVTRCI